jgi:hypothetical protein
MLNSSAFNSLYNPNIYRYPDKYKYIKLFKKYEYIGMKDARAAYRYARYWLQDRFLLGEPVIAKDSYYSYLYAKKVIKGRFELGESAIRESNYLLKIYKKELDLEDIVI